MPSAPDSWLIWARRRWRCSPPLPGEAILDLGCGDGVLTERIAASGARVLGVDASAAMVEAASARGINAQLADGELLMLEDRFDAVFSNAALHWMKHDPDTVIANVWRVLRPGGRFVGEMGGAGNVARITAAHYKVLAKRGLDAACAGPWHFPDLEDYARRLQRTEVQSWTRCVPPCCQRLATPPAFGR